jgi:Tfp pilus assembly protein PilX
MILKTRLTGKRASSAVFEASRCQKSSGFSIVLTLLVIVMMTVLVIGFNAATRTEQMAARNLNYQEQANQMAMSAVSKGLELINGSVTNGVVTRPGFCFNPESGFAKNLTSEGYAKAPMTNINANEWEEKVSTSSGTITNFIIFPSTNQTTFGVPIFVVKSGTNTNPIGLWCFWIDDDGTRLNLNAAWTNARSNFLPTNARPLGLIFSNIFPTVTTNYGNFAKNLALCITTAVNTNGYGYFFTPRQAQVMFWPNRNTVRMGTPAADYNRIMFSIGAGPLNWRPSNSYALSSNSVAAALDVTNGFLAAYGSAGYAGSLSALNTALDSVSGKFFRGAKYGRFFGQANGFAAKYGNNGMWQIIANINDATITGGNGTFTGANATDMLATNGGGTTPVIPSTVLGLRPAIFLNEVAVGVAYATNGGLDGNPELQVFMKSEMVDPYRSGLGGTYEILYGLKSLEFSGTYQAEGATITFKNSAETTTNPVREGVVRGLGGMGQEFRNNLKSFYVPTNAYGFEWQIGTNGTTPRLPPTASNIVINSMTVRPSYAVIRARQGTPTTVRDWAAFADFPSNGFKFNNPPLVAKAIGYTNSRELPEPNSLFTQSIEKNDPRVRRFGTNAMPTNFPAWTFVSTPTLGANNSSVNFSGGTGIAGVGNDPVGAINNIYDHPSFPTNADPNNPTNITLGRSNWISAFDLSKIHTGLQWRTLQFRAQDPAESAAGHVPDWALLEALAVTNTNVAGPAIAYKLNINSLVSPAASNTPAMNLIANGLARPQAVAALLSGMTNAASAAIGSSSLGFPAAASFSNSSHLRVATNIASLAFTSNWALRRSANAAAYQANLYSLPAEVLEINDVSNFSTDEAANEARAQGIYTGITVASQVFTVYAAGFATDKTGAVVAESRMRAQVARDTNTGKFKIVFLEPLIWP